MLSPVEPNDRKPSMIRNFVTAGAATFTIASQKTGAHYTSVILPAIGSYVRVPFGSRAKQTALVCGYSRDGKTIKVRAWNATRNHWMPNPRPVPFGDWIEQLPARPAHLPPPPARLKRGLSFSQQDTTQ
jgi:hypothetical protein